MDRTATTDGNICGLLMKAIGVYTGNMIGVMESSFVFTLAPLCFMRGTSSIMAFPLLRSKIAIRVERWEWAT